MSLQGKIIHFDKSKGIGDISYGKFLAIRFHIASILNYQDINFELVGRQVKFSILDIRGKKSAIDIVLTSPVHIKRSSPIDHLNKIVKYNYENWEEIERIIEAPSELYENEELTPASQNDKIDHKFLALAILENKIKLVSFTKDGRFNYKDETQKYHNIIYPFHFEEASLSVAIEEFEYLINNKKADEDDFQDFLERNPKFILNDEYKQAHPHIILAKTGREKLIPDFVLEPINQPAFCDLLELKLPTANIFVMKKNRQHFSAAITEAARQLQVYHDYFNETANRNKFQQTYPHLQIYKPKMFLIIGRQTPHDALIKRDIQATAPQLIINNFDDLLARMKWKKEKLKSNNKLFS
jgi:hypothetical protein